jgi:hypothetical protein
MQDLFAQLDAIGARVNLQRHRFDDPRWSCIIEHAHEDTSLHVIGKGSTAEEALEAACNKFFAAAKRGVALPLIVDHSQGERPDDDDLPF